VRVVGLDLSLTSTGMAVVDKDLGTYGSEPAFQVATVKPGKVRGYERLDLIENRVLGAIEGADIVVVEGPSFGSTGSSFHQLGGLWWIITRLVQREHQMMVASPSVIKKYATGKGNADKDAMMLMTARRFPTFEGDNNAADALWLACAGAEKQYGIQVVQAHSEALEKWTGTE
jgi:crossover junction endodeoxyribonuclease RuvC